MKTKVIFQIISIVLFLVVMTYWVIILHDLVTVEVSDDLENYIGSFSIYLISWSFILGVVNLTAWMNFRFIFLKWKQSTISSFLFVAIELFLLLVIFEILQWTTQYESIMMKDNLSVTLIIALYSLAFTWIADLINTKKNQSQLLQQKESAELRLLQSQLNPHFLFNALNMTYSTAVGENSLKTADQILKIADLMRFALEKSKFDFISIGEEIGFLEKYIHIQKERFSQSNKESIKSGMNWDGFEVSISPMLLQPFLENAFKFTQFGSGQGKTKLEIDLRVENGVLNFHLGNSYLIQDVMKNKGTGTGIQLVKQRLKGIYPGRHELKIEDCDGFFAVSLEIKLKD